MIHYESNSISFAFGRAGSNIPKATLYALPSVLIAIGFHIVMTEFSDTFGILKDMDLMVFLSASAIVMSVLLGLRTTRAYDRFWEGITLVQMMRAEWFQAASTLVAFSNVGIKKNPKNKQVHDDVHNFQFLLVRLMSLMHGSALRQIGGHEEDFDVVDITGLDEVSLGYLASCEDRQVNPVEVLLHWIQILITDTLTSSQALPVPPPILTRVFQTLSRGMVNCHNARKLVDCPFPFPLFQMVHVLLIVQCLITPIIITASLDHVVLSAVCSFVPIFGMWSITFTAGELEQPFGNDPNDLPLTSIQKQYNTSLMMLLDRETLRAPSLATKSLSVKDFRKAHSLHTMSETSKTNTISSFEPLNLPPSESDDQSVPSKSPGFTLEERNSAAEIAELPKIVGQAVGDAYRWQSLAYELTNPGWFPEGTGDTKDCANKPGQSEQDSNVHSSEAGASEQEKASSRNSRTKGSKHSDGPSTPRFDEKTGESFRLPRKSKERSELATASVGEIPPTFATRMPITSLHQIVPSKKLERHKTRTPREEQQSSVVQSAVCGHC